MNDAITYTYPADESEERLATFSPPASYAKTAGTYFPRFEVLRPYLSEKPLTHPNRTRPLRHLTNEELKRIAASNPPPPEWFEGEEERPF